MTEALSEVWRLAALDLDVEVIAPFEFPGAESGEVARCVAFVAGFGSPEGTVVVGRHASTGHVRALADARGMFLSMVDEQAFEEYDRVLFIDTLNDWGWHGGEKDPPGWFTGKPWTS
jgi:hypothetical protein